MCIIFVNTNPKPKIGEHRLIIASNRDEYYKRPAKEAFVCSDTKIIGGRDLEANRENGMWLGLKVNEQNRKNIRFSALLNVTGAESCTGVQSRGFIVPSYLQSEKTSIDFFEDLTNKQSFNAFSLVNVELNENEATVFFLSKHPEQVCKFSEEQTLGFSNSPVNRPFTKVRNGRCQFENIVTQHKTNDELRKALIQFLKSTEKHLPDPELGSRIPIEVEGRSSIFVQINKIYGTRTHTVILVDYDWNVEFYEETMESPIDANKIIWKKNLIVA